MTSDSSRRISPFPMPRVECRECGKEPHEGYCYPVLDGLIGVLLVLAAVGAIIALMLWMAA